MASMILFVKVKPEGGLLCTPCPMCCYRNLPDFDVIRAASRPDVLQIGNDTAQLW